MVVDSQDAEIYKIKDSAYGPESDGEVPTFKLRLMHAQKFAES
jgi:hypothetical protein